MNASGSCGSVGVVPRRPTASAPYRSPAISGGPVTVAQTAPTRTEQSTESPVQPIPDGRSFVRLDPAQAAVAQLHGALLIDIRPSGDRAREGEVPGALIVAGPMRDWRVEAGDALRVC